MRVALRKRACTQKRRTPKLQVPGNTTDGGQRGFIEDMKTFSLSAEKSLRNIRDLIYCRMGPLGPLGPLKKRSCSAPQSCRNPAVACRRYISHSNLKFHVAILMNSGSYGRWRGAPKQKNPNSNFVLFIGRLLLEFPNSGAIFMRSSKQGTNNEFLGCMGCIATHDVGRWGSGRHYRIGACRTCRWNFWGLNLQSFRPVHAQSLN